MLATKVLETSAIGWILTAVFVLLFDASYGVLLKDELHHLYDRLECSLYSKVCPLQRHDVTSWRARMLRAHNQDVDFTVHCFTLSQSDTAMLHGGRITTDRFRGLTESRPDHRLVEWHYKQSHAGFLGRDGIEYNDFLAVWYSNMA